MNPSAGFLLLLLLHACQCSGQTTNTTSVNPLKVYQQCATESNLPAPNASTPLLKTVLQIASTQLGIDKVISCVEGKLDRLMNSSDAIEAFVGYTFDRKQATENLAKFRSAPSISSCLSTTLVPALSTCLHSVLPVIQSHASPRTTHNFCKLDIGKCLMHQANCSKEDQDLSMAISKLFYGQCAGKWQPDPVHSLFASCGNQLFGELPMLYPPSEVTVPHIVNMTAAALYHRQSMKTFCSKSEAYATCIQQGFRDPGSSLSASDVVLRNVFDINNLQTAVRAFCRLLDTNVTNDQFKCVASRVRMHPCNGGMFEMFAASMTPDVQKAPKTQVCRRFKDAQSCRVQHQLTPCSERLGEQMAVVYKNLMISRCGDEDSQIGQCAQKYGQEFNKGMSSQNFSPKDISGPIAYATKHICRVRKSFMQECIRSIERNASHQADKLILRIFVPANLEILLDYLCSKTKVIEDHGFCAVTAVAAKLAATNSSNCYTDLAHAFEKKKQEIVSQLDTTNLTTVIDSLISSSCFLMKPVPSCFASMVEKCHADIAELVSTALGYMIRSCGQLRAMPIEQTSAANRNLATTTGAILLPLVVWMISI